MIETALDASLEHRELTNHRRPRIVLLASIGYVVRNYLLGDFLSSLVRQSHVTVLSPLVGQDQFRKLMEARGVEVSDLETPTLDPSWERLRKWREVFHAAWLDTDTLRLKQTPSKQGPTNSMQRARNLFRRRMAQSLTGPRLLRELDKRDDRRALRSSAGEHYRRYFSQTRPSLVFSPAPLMTGEWVPIQVARSMGIPTVLSVLSWDNLSSKARMPGPCSAYIVWNEEMRRELLQYYPDIHSKRVHIAGTPQFDFYARSTFRKSREEFVRGLGGDPHRPLVVYAGVPSRMVPNEPQIIASLVEAIRLGAIKRQPQLLVRLHPKDDGNRYAEFRHSYPEVLFTSPGERHHGDLKNWQPDDQDLSLLVNTVRHGDVHINVASTMTLDAAVMDRPVINVMYDLRPPTALKPWGLRQYECTHYLPLLKTGGVRLARTPEALFLNINDYLDDPSLDREGRRRIVELKCGKVDGRAGERTAAKLLELVNSNRPLDEKTDPSRATFHL